MVTVFCVFVKQTGIYNKISDHAHALARNITIVNAYSADGSLFGR